MKKDSQRPFGFYLVYWTHFNEETKPHFHSIFVPFHLKNMFVRNSEYFPKVFSQQYKVRVLDLTSTLRLRSVLLLKCTFQLALDLWKWKWAVKEHANDFEVIIKSGEQINDVIIFNAFQERSTLITTETSLREI